MADLIYPNGMTLADILANINNFSSNPATSQGKGELIYNTNDDNVYKNTGTAGTPVWEALGSGGDETGTPNDTWTINNDAVSAEDSSVDFERGTETNSSVFCTGATGNVGVKVAGATVLEANPTNIDVVVPINFDDVAGKTRIYSEGSVGAKDIVVEVETGRSIIFRTVV